MAFLEELGKKAQDVANVASEKAQVVAAKVSEKAGDVADRAKTEYAILMEKYSLERNYRAIGEWYANEVGDDVPEAAADIISAIRASRAKIAELEATRPAKAEKAPAGETKTCPNCGKEVSSRFCPDCGMEME